MHKYAFELKIVDIIYLGWWSTPSPGWTSMENRLAAMLDDLQNNHPWCYSCGKKYFNLESTLNPILSNIKVTLVSPLFSPVCMCTVKWLLSPFFIHFWHATLIMCVLPYLLSKWPHAKLYHIVWGWAIVKAHISYFWGIWHHGGFIQQFKSETLEGWTFEFRNTNCRCLSWITNTLNNRYNYILLHEQEFSE